MRSCSYGPLSPPRICLSTILEQRPSYLPQLGSRVIELPDEEQLYSGFGNILAKPCKLGAYEEDVQPDPASVEVVVAAVELRNN